VFAAKFPTAPAMAVTAWKETGDGEGKELFIPG